MCSFCCWCASLCMLTRLFCCCLQELCEAQGVVQLPRPCVHGEKCCVCVSQYRPSTWACRLFNSTAASTFQTVASTASTDHLAAAADVQVFEKLGPSLYDYLRRNEYQPLPLGLVQVRGREAEGRA